MSKKDHSSLKQSKDLFINFLLDVKKDYSILKQFKTSHSSISSHSPISRQSLSQLPPEEKKDFLLSIKMTSETEPAQEEPALTPNHPNITTKV